jgi:hypothetical protein
MLSSVQREKARELYREQSLIKAREVMKETMT